jgi:hypothetical protein
LTLKVEVPAAVGVPAITPVEEMARPTGHVPDVTDHVYGGTPPVAARVCEYGAPRKLVGKVEGVATASGPRLMVSVNDRPTKCRVASLTLTLNVEIPAVTGIPPITPAEERARRGGSAPG